MKLKIKNNVNLIISTLILSILFGFGIWYVKFWFVSNESNMFEWHWITKLVYLILGGLTTRSIFDGLTKNL